MTDFEKVNRIRRDLEEMRSDLTRRIDRDTRGKPDLVILHERVSRAIKALSAEG